MDARLENAHDRFPANIRLKEADNWMVGITCTKKAVKVIRNLEEQGYALHCALKQVGLVLDE